MVLVRCDHATGTGPLGTSVAPEVPLQLREFRRAKYDYGADADLHGLGVCTHRRCRRDSRRYARHTVTAGVAAVPGKPHQSGPVRILLHGDKENTFKMN